MCNEGMCVTGSSTPFVVTGRYAFKISHQGGSGARDCFGVFRGYMNIVTSYSASSRKRIQALSFCSLSVLLVACGSGSGGGQDPDPLVEDIGIAYVQRPLSFDSNDELIKPDRREVLTFTPGGDLLYRDFASPSAKVRNITDTFTGGAGDVRDVAVSYDGNLLLFSMRAPEIDGADPEDQPTWNIWEYDITTRELRRIIAADVNAQAGQDISPHYLPDGRIIFASTRQQTAKAILLDEGKQQYAALNEARNEHAAVLHVMNSDGSDIHQVSFNQSHDLDPLVISSGEVVFSRWDHMGNRDAISLYKMHPDGSELQLLYGAHSHDTGTNGNDVHFLQPRELENGQLLTVLLPRVQLPTADPGIFNEVIMDAGDLLAIDINNYVDNTQPIAINQGILSGPAQQSTVINKVYTDGEISPGGLFRSAWPLHDGTNRVLVSWSQCRLLDGNRIIPCTPDDLAKPNAVEANPAYGIFLYDRNSDTQLPVVVAKDGFMFTDVVAAESRELPAILFDKQAGIELDQQLIEEGVGILNIRSVYDVDGVDTAVPDIATLADPGLSDPDNRPARFLRIVKAVGIPDDEVRDIPGTAFGRSSRQLMREIVGYVPVQPDGSVRVKVPANIPFAISVLDREGRRITARHQNWLQVRAGETIHCNGCHDHDSGSAHGHPQAQVSVYTGALLTGPPFPNTDPALFANFSESMADTLTRLDTNALNPDVDLIYDDVWTDDSGALVKAPSFVFSYADLQTPVPVSQHCQDNWSNSCRIIINYEEHIHPLWDRDRGASTCTACHTTDNGTRVPDSQLDLTDGISGDEADHFKAYRELLFDDFEQELGGNGLQDVLVSGPIDPVTNLPTQVPVDVMASMRVAGSLASTAFVSRFNPAGSHAGRLDPAELRLIFEWLDIGAQYYNDPFAVPDN